MLTKEECLCLCLCLCKFASLAQIWHHGACSGLVVCAGCVLPIFKPSSLGQATEGADTRSRRALVLCLLPVRASDLMTCVLPSGPSAVCHKPWGLALNISIVYNLERTKAFIGALSCVCVCRCELLGEKLQGMREEPGLGGVTCWSACFRLESCLWVDPVWGMLRTMLVGFQGFLSCGSLQSKPSPKLSSNNRTLCKHTHTSGRHFSFHSRLPCNSVEWQDLVPAAVSTYSRHPSAQAWPIPEACLLGAAHWCPLAGGCTSAAQKVDGACGGQGRQGHLGPVWNLLS